MPKHRLLNMVNLAGTYLNTGYLIWSIWGYIPKHRLLNMVNLAGTYLNTG